MMIQPKYLKLHELLNGRLFRIPHYQRAYSWEEKQRNNLFSDIERLHTDASDSVHFMATMVGLNRGRKIIESDEYHEIEVVDGQQRLTTLVILFKALSIALNRKDKKENALADEIDSLLIKNDDHSLLLLQTNHDTSNYFANFIRNNTYPKQTEAKTLADRLLLAAMADCKKFVERWAGTRIQLGAILKNRLALIFHEIEDEAAVYTVFEVLNSRGLDVAWLDRLKSTLMGIAFTSSKGNRKETIHELHTVWGDIYRCIGPHQGRSSESLRFAATLKSEDSLSKVLSEEDAVDTLVKAAENSIKGTNEISRWILSVVQAVDKLTSDRTRTAVTKIAHARLLAVAIELHPPLKAKRNELLKAWEKVTFRIFGMCRRDARTGVGDFVRLARSLISDNVKHSEALERIRGLATDKFSIENAIGELRNQNCYEGWEEQLRYFFQRYEESLAREQGQNFDNAQWAKIWQSSAMHSIEHICPQSHGAPRPTRSKKTIFVHRLGNLVMLPPRLNSKLQDSDPAQKADEYVKTGLLIASKLKPALKNWTPVAVEKREDELLKWASEEWSDDS